MRPSGSERLWDLPYGPHLYLHVPFCRAKCRYCDFVSFAGREEVYEAYVQALCREVREAGRGEARSLLGGTGPATLYIGGGTPTVLPLAGLTALLEAAGLFDLSGAEVTVEANPGTVSLEKLRVLRSAGVNRLSLGVQSFSAAALAMLGRIHTAEEARQAYVWARQAGLDSVNLDLIFGLPGQSLDDWKHDLEEALALAPDHLSLYCLTLEAGTPLAGDVERGELPAPDEDLAAEMYRWAEERLDRAGYRHYEISNWARPGHLCRHNIAYWRDEDYLGCGVAAHSHQGRRRWANTGRLEEYLRAIAEGRSPVVQEEETDPATAMGETMMLGLRLAEGVPRGVFRRRYGVEMEAVYASALADLASAGLVVVDEEGVRLTARGRLLGNPVFERFLP